MSSLEGTDAWERTFKFHTAKTIGRGTSGTIFAIDDTQVLKYFPEDEEGRDDLARELEVFNEVKSCGGSEHIVKFYKKWHSGLVLERHDSTVRKELANFAEKNPGSRHPLALQWSLESCKGLDFLHQQGILHGDVGCQNVLVSNKGHAKLCDFARSSIRGSHARDGGYESRSQHPLYSGGPRIETEIFAFGSLLFEIWTSRPPYASETDLAVIKKNFLAGEFPLGSVKGMDIEEIINKCWKEGYDKVSTICKDLENIK